MPWHWPLSWAWLFYSSHVASPRDCSFHPQWELTPLRLVSIALIITLRYPDLRRVGCSRWLDFPRFHFRRTVSFRLPSYVLEDWIAQSTASLSEKYATTASLEIIVRFGQDVRLRNSGFAIHRVDYFTTDSWGFRGCHGSSLKKQNP